MQIREKKWKMKESNFWKNFLNEISKIIKYLNVSEEEVIITLLRLFLLNNQINYFIIIIVC